MSTRHDEQMRELLSTWQETWRSPAIWRAHVLGDIEPHAIGRAYLRHLASPALPAAVLSTLIEAKAFQAAEALLAHDAFGAACPKTPPAEEERRLLDVQWRKDLAQADILHEQEALRRRARIAHVKLDAHEETLEQVVLWAIRDDEQAAALLQTVKEVIYAAETTCLNDLRRAFREKQAAPSSDADCATWVDRVEAALDNRDLELARGLLATEPGAVRGLPEHGLPAPIESGPFGGRPAAELCQWALTGGGPANFYARWDPLRDPRHRPLIVALNALATATPCSPADVAAFAGALEALFGVDPAPPRVETFHDGFRTTVRGLGDRACVAFPASGVPLYIEPAGRSLEPVLPRHETFALFTLNHGAVSSAGPVLTVWDLFRCLARPDDLVFNLLRLLSAQLPAGRRFPHEKPPTSWRLHDAHRQSLFTPFGTLRAMAERALNLTNGRVVEPAVLDRLAFRATERLPLLYAYLRALFLELDERAALATAVITLDDLDVAYGRPEFREAAIRLFVQPIEADRVTQAVFAASLVVFELQGDRQDGGQASVADVEQWLASEALEIPTPLVLDALSALQDIGLVQLTPSPAGPTLAKRPAGYLAGTLVGDPLTYLASARGAGAASVAPGHA